MEETKKFGNTIITIIVLLALGFGIYYLISNNSAPVVEQPLPGSDYYVSVVQVKHQYKDGMHTYVGSIDLPHACYKLESNSTKTTDQSASIALATSLNTEELCAQVVTSRTFRSQVAGEAMMTVTGTLNGRPVELNVFEVPADQDIDAFEINVKG